MKSMDDLFNRVAELQYSIINSDLNTGSASLILNELDTDLRKSQHDSIGKGNSIIRSFLITFNINCFSDLTILFLSSSGKISIIEYAGNETVFTEVKVMFEHEINFFKDMDKLNVKGNYYRIFYESMENDNGLYTLLTFTESAFFKPSRFHMLADVLMDIIRSGDKTENSVIEDFFENAVVQLNTFINKSTIAEPEMYLFIFENIHDFFLEMGLDVLIELSGTIRKKMLEEFGSQSGVIALSLSRYIVISPAGNLSDNKIMKLKNSTLMEFSYKGIMLQYHCIRIPFNNDSIYDIIENIFHVNDERRDHKIAGKISD